MTLCACSTRFAALNLASTDEACLHFAREYGTAVLLRTTQVAPRAKTASLGKRTRRDGATDASAVAPATVSAPKKGPAVRTGMGPAANLGAPRLVSPGDHPDDIEAARRLLAERRRLRAKLSAAAARAAADKAALQAREVQLRAEQARVEAARVKLAELEAKLERERSSLRLT